MSSPTIIRLRRNFYPRPVNTDQLLIARIEAAITPGSRVLDVGAGSGRRFKHSLKYKAKQVIGVDVDSSVAQNPNLTEFHIGGSNNMPFLADSSIDCAFSRYVLEHLYSPTLVFRELRRVLKPGAPFIFITPSRWHYVSVIAALTPQRFHNWMATKRGLCPEETFRTYYRANSKRQLCQILRNCPGLSLVELEYIESFPGYLVFSPLLFMLGVLYERTVNGFPFLRMFRASMIGRVVRGA